MLPTLLLATTLSVGQPPRATPSGPPSAPNIVMPLGSPRPSGGPGAVPTCASDAITPAPSAPAANLSANGPGDANSVDGGESGNGEDTSGGFLKRFLREYPSVRATFPNWLGKPEEKKENGEETASPARRALPAPLASPPFPTGEWQGFPLVGLPPSDTVYPLTKALYGGVLGDFMKDHRLKAYGWVNASGNWSTSTTSNTPDSYWVVPNSYQLDQLVFRLEREVDSNQIDHLDWGFRSTHLFGIDYRYMTAGGYFSKQLLKYNNLYGYDPTEQYFNLYVPGIAQGMIITVGRWIATPDIETQFGPDNYLGTHSLLFTVDVYSESGVMATVMLNKYWTVQAAIHAGADMAPWYAGAMPTGMFGVRWVSHDNNDSVYTVLNAINNAEYQYFTLDGVPAGHHNYNIIQTTWQHRVSDRVHTKTEAYLMWENNAAVGGTPSIGPVAFGSGGGLGPTIPGTSLNVAALNYTMLKLTDSHFMTIRNEWVHDQHGTRYGFAGNYTSHTLGFTFNLTPLMQVRPEIGYYRNWDRPAFDNGLRQGMLLYGFDMTMRF